MSRDFVSRHCKTEKPHYRRLNDIAQEAIVLVKDSVVLDVNSRFLVMLGVEHPEEVIGDSVKQLGLRRIWKLRAHRRKRGCLTGAIG